MYTDDFQAFIKFNLTMMRSFIKVYKSLVRNLSTQIKSSGNIPTPMTSIANLPSNAAIAANGRLSKYAQLLAVVKEIGRDLRPASIGSRGSTERLKRSIVHARVLVRECIMEIERSGLD
uniref:Cyclin-dependent kinase 2-associated protein n=1 Tax=Glossina pallidipes TaxID=7398 RepID=A0A1B0A6I1_GLOPL